MQKNNVDQNALADQPSYFASDDLKNASAAKIVILFVHYGDARLRGSERCLLNLIANLDKNRFSPIVWCNSENLAQQCNNLAIPAYVDHFALFFDPPKSNATLKTFSGLITRAIELINLHHVQLIHANNGAPSQWLIWAARKAKLPLLQHLHACYPFYQRLGFAFYHTSMTICVSRAVQKQLLDDGCEPRRCQVVANGADVDALLAQQVVDLRQILHLPASAFIAVTVGELVYAKGFDLLLEASFSLRKKGFSLELVVIGDGELRGELQAQAAELGLQTHVHFLGQQPAVIGLLRGGADLYVSGTREESFGLSLLEASIAKLAVVAPLVGGISDVIEHEKTGILVEPNSSAAIADAISELYNDKTRRTALGEQGFKSALEKFNLQTYVDKMSDCYLQLLQDKRAALSWFSHWQPWPIWQGGLRFIKKYVQKKCKKNMSAKRAHLLVLDPIAFAGGSKIATQAMLEQMTEKPQITLLSCDLASWTLANLTKKKLWLPRFLQSSEQGIGFFLRHSVIALQIIWLHFSHGKITTAIGASGPGVDYALYLAQKIINYRLAQFIHGPVAASRVIGRSLLQASKVFYLDFTHESLLKALARVGKGADIFKPPHDNLLKFNKNNFQAFRNGLSAQNWPTACQYQEPVLLWAASLLKWKGLDLLVQALESIDEKERPLTQICYIHPQQTQLPISALPKASPVVFCHENSCNLDDIRKQCNIFISTSEKEPFGLSILEAMAAGMCVIIPRDGAYWDKQLQHDVNCLKYQPHDSENLANTIQIAQKSLPLVKRLGESAKQISMQYQAKQCYADITAYLSVDEKLHSGNKLDEH